MTADMALTVGNQRSTLVAVASPTEGLRVKHVRTKVAVAVAATAAVVGIGGVGLANQSGDPTAGGAVNDSRDSDRGRGRSPGSPPTKPRAGVYFQNEETLQGWDDPHPHPQWKGVIKDVGSPAHKDGTAIMAQQTYVKSNGMRYH